MLKSLVRGSLRRLGYDIVRAYVPGELARVRGELDASRRLLGQSEQECADLARDLAGYTNALRVREDELGETRTDLGNARVDLEGYKGAYHAVARELGEYKAAHGQPGWRGPWPQVCFMHIGKTAGTSVHNLLVRLFDPARTYHADPDTFDRLAPGGADRYDLVLGHCSYRHVAAFRPHRVMFSFVREPVERVVSNYYFLRAWRGEINDQNRDMVASAKRYSLLDFLKDDHPRVRYTYDNHQVYAFASDARADRSGDAAAVLAAALAHLDEFAVVGLTDRADDALALIARHLHWLPFPPLARHNVTSDRPRVADLTGAERAAVEACTRLDAQLCEAAKRRFERQWEAAHPARG